MHLMMDKFFPSRAGSFIKSNLHLTNKCRMKTTLWMNEKMLSFFFPLFSLHIQCICESGLFFASLNNTSLQVSQNEECKCESFPPCALLGQVESALCTVHSKRQVLRHADVVSLVSELTRHCTCSFHEEAQDVLFIFPASRSGNRTS